MPTPVSDNSTAKPLSLEEEFIALIEKNCRRHLLPMWIMLAFIASFSISESNIFLPVFWGLSASAILFTRVYCVLNLFPNLNISNQKKINILYLFNGLSGLFLGLSMYFFPDHSPVEITIHTIILAGLCIGVAASNAGFPLATIPYIALTMGPLALAWFLFPPIQDAAWKSYTFVLIVLIFGTLMISISKEIFRLFSNAVEMRQQYANINTQLSQALKSSEASNAAKTRFLAAASHDLRQPVHTLSLLTAALMSRDLDKRTGDISVTMNQSLQSLSKQLDSLLDISKLDAGIVTPQLNNINLKTLLEHIKEQLQPRADEKGLALTLSCPNSIAVNSDAILLQRIIENLVVNALKYCEQGSIDIIVKTDDTRVTIEIKDTGIGIEKDKQELIFEEFYQLNNPSRDRSKGLGLGLSIVKRLVELLNIGLDMHSEPGVGTEFSLTLKAASQIIMENNSPPTTVDFSDINILVVDDEEEIRLAASIFLEEMHCKVQVAEGTSQAETMAKENRPDILITDFRLQGEDNGLKCIKAIRAIYPNIPAVIITGDTAPDRLSEAHEADAKLLHKPIDTNELKQVINQVIDSSIRVAEKA